MNNMRVYILILNWNGWRDTIECLESVFRNDYPNYKVIVCDNNSSDDSVKKITNWAEGKIYVDLPDCNTLKYFSTPPVSKPIKFVYYEKEEAEKGGSIEDKDSKLILIQTGDNLGFAGGNNVGVRYALLKNNFAYIWMLNNDTVIRPDALTKMVDRMSENDQGGMCGSTVLYYNFPNTIQALGGARFNSWLATTKHIGENQTRNKYVIDCEKIEKILDYIFGASMLISKEFITKIGLLNEDYFLYFEEIDWALRSKNKFNLYYAHESIVYHKGGKSTNSHSLVKTKSNITDYYLIKNRIKITKRYYKAKLFTVYFGVLLAMFNRIKRREWSKVVMIIKEIICK